MRIIFVLIALSLYGNAYGERPYVMVGLGDSITKAMNSTGLSLDKPELSWSTGNEKNQRVLSHYWRIREITSLEVEAYNFAKSGSKAEDLAKQVDKLLEKNPDYVTLLIGANDLCSWDKDDPAQLERFRETVGHNLERVISNNPEVQLLLVPIPDMYQLWSVGKENSCQWTWDLLQICQPLLGRNRTEEDRLAFRDRWEAVNAALKELSENFSRNVSFPQVQDYAFEREDISSFDCFHPSVKGQNIFSDLTWNPNWLQIP